jgi:peptidoglycan/LPS O-acetylase OafA/YrhL
VALFFSLTAFPFWEKALGSAGKVDPVKLFLNRVHRIAPMYFVSLAAAGVILLVLAKFQFSTPVKTLALEAGRMFFLGFFGFPQDSINGTPVNMVNAGVFWTLRYEWAYYFFLPLLALTLRRPKIFVVFVLVFAVASALRPSIQIARLGPFVLGMCAAQLISWRGHSALLRSRYMAMIAVFSLLLVPFTMGTYRAETHQPAWKPVTTLCIALPFIVAAYGNDFFGLLKMRGAKGPWAHQL